jgi:multidrug resistance efflux pump
MKRKPALGIFFLALLALATIYFFLSTNHRRGLIIDGIVDANQVVVSRKVQGLLERLLVDEGSSVRAGERIASLDTGRLRVDWCTARKFSFLMSRRPGLIPSPGSTFGRCSREFNVKGTSQFS